MILYRDATPADYPQLADCARETWMETFAPHYSEADREAYLAKTYGPEGDLPRHLADPAHAYRIACEGERVIGYAKLNAPWLPEAEPEAMQLSQIYVLTAHHGSGVGAVLMDWAVEAARAKGAQALLLTVWENNPRAIRFYEKRGFVHIGDYAYAVGAQVDRDLILRLAL